jgi:hypothetical protein
VKPAVQELMALVPVFWTVTAAWSPPGHEFETAYVRPQSPGAADAVAATSPAPAVSTAAVSRPAT